MSLTSLLRSPALLRRVLWVDALTGVASAVLQLSLTDSLAQQQGLPAALLRGSAWALFGYVALAVFLVTRDAIPRKLLAILVAGNWIWAAACLWLVFAGGLSPTALGLANLVAQAMFVAALATLQSFGLTFMNPGRRPG
jgi:hypothetical protein